MYSRSEHGRGEGSSRPDDVMLKAKSDRGLF